MWAAGETAAKTLATQEQRISPCDGVIHCSESQRIMFGVLPCRTDRFICQIKQIFIVKEEISIRIIVIIRTSVKNLFWDLSYIYWVVPGVSNFSCTASSLPLGNIRDASESAKASIVDMFS